MNALTDSHVVPQGISRVVERQARFSYRTLLIGCLVAFGYFIGAKVGLALTFHPHPVSVMWPPNSILLAALLLTPVRLWWFVLLAAFPAHLAAELESHVPLRMVLCWFISNCFEAVIGAAGTRVFVNRFRQFENFRSIGIFFFFGTFLAPFLSSFLDAAFVMWNHWGTEDYWHVWRIRFLSNIFTSMVLVPAIVTWAGPLTRKRRPAGRWTEMLFLVVSLLAVCFVIFYRLEADGEMIPTLLYVPLPFLLWAAVRFGTRGISLAILVVAISAIWSATHAHGPFVASSPEDSAFSIQMFMVVISIALLPLAAVLNERKQAEDALRVSEERYRDVVESQTEFVCRFLPDTTLSFVNQAYCDFFRRSREELIGRKFLELVPLSMHKMLLLEIASLMVHRRTTTVEHEVLLPDGTVGWQQWINHPIQDPEGNVREIQAIGTDITKRRQAETALRESEERNRAILEAIPDLMFLQTQSGDYLDYHARDESVLLVPPKEFLGRNIRDVLPSALADEFLRCFDSAGKTGEVQVMEYTLPIGGKTRHFEARIARTGADKMLSLVHEITERKRAQEALRETQERYREVVESQTDLVTRHLPDMTLTFVNEACCRFFRQQREALIGRKFLEFLPPQVHETVLKNARTVVADRRPVTCEQVVLKPDGSTQWLLWNIHPIVDVDGSVAEIQSIGRDITDRKRAEEATQKLHHALRLAVLGEFTAMIAHEVNQPLNAILNNAEAAEILLSSPPVPLDEIRNILSDIRSDDLRAGKTIARIRALSQSRDVDFGPLEINGLIEDVIRLVTGDASRRHVRIRTEFATGLPRASGNPVQVQQVLLNLIANGMDAMSDVAENERLLILKTKRNDNDDLLVSVQDGGHGIPPGVSARLFESFFSTKKNGMGLGLSISRSIVLAHHGRIWAENNPDRGATFQFTLPLDKEGNGNGQG
jgi:PAS domain S-box-containing protein